MAKSQLAPMATGRLRFHLQGIPVFVYHGILAANHPVIAEEKKYSISQEQFHSHLEVIRSQSVGLLTLSELWRRATAPNGAALAAAFTFDDGHVSDYEQAFPYLMQYGYRADFFVNPATVNRSGFLNWTQMTEMQKAGMSFQSHGWSHTALTHLSPSTLRDQLRSSKKELQNRLGTRVEFLSAPFGEINRRVTETALEVGYRAVCNSRQWPAQVGSAHINRAAIYPHTTPAAIAKLLRGDLWTYTARMARSALIYMPKHILHSLRPEMVGVRNSGAEA